MNVFLFKTLLKFILCFSLPFFSINAFADSHQDHSSDTAQEVSDTDGGQHCENCDCDKPCEVECACEECDCNSCECETCDCDTCDEGNCSCAEQEGGCQDGACPSSQCDTCDCEKCGSQGDCDCTCEGGCTADREQN